MAEVRLLGERVEVTLPVLLLEFPFLPHVIPPTVLKNPLLKTPTESRVEWWPRCRRLEEGERKRGWRKRKEENGVQAPNRAEIILDHKGWNSIENLGYSKNCQSIVEKGKRPDEQDVGVEGQVQVLTAWPEKKRRVNDTLSLIFFLKNTSSPVNVMEKWRTAWRCWKENSYAKMRSWRELKKNWYVLRMTLFIYPLKRKSENLWTLGVRKIKEFNPHGICGGHLWT